jgi:phosphomethylpyrimidine synthase
MSVFSKNAALEQVLARHLDSLCAEEGLAPSVVRDAIEAGSMVLLGNPAHPRLTPLLVGQPARAKVNANLGTSPLDNCPEAEAEKIRAALEAGADTLMDLSIAGELDALRRAMLATCPLPVGTVPMYEVGQRMLDAGESIAAMRPEEMFAVIAKQAEQGVDFMTVHCGLTRRGAEFAARGSRALGIVSRGGSMLARWMLENGRENPLLEGFDRIVEIALRHNVTLSLGDGLRPGAGVDAGDAAQWEEVIMLGQLARQALAAGVQCMIEGPGHVPLHEVEAQIRTIKRLTNNAPLYVLGPLTIDSSPGYDHIAGAIGGSLAVRAGADFLCYVTPAEHLTLPDAADVRAGVMASRVAAQSGEVALGVPHALRREKAMNDARKALDWTGMAAAALDPSMLHTRREVHKDEEVCAMCGKFCAVKMLRETGTAPAGR